MRSRLALSRYARCVSNPYRRQAQMPPEARQWRTRTRTVGPFALMVVLGLLAWALDGPTPPGLDALQAAMRARPNHSE